MNIEEEDPPFMILMFVAMLVVIVIWCIGLYRTGELIVKWLS